MQQKRTGFTSVFQPGPAWLTGLELEQQPGWFDNLRYWQDQARATRMSLIGAVAGMPGTGLAVWYVGDVEEAREIVENTPFVRRRVFVAKTVSDLPVF